MKVLKLEKQLPGKLLLLVGITAGLTACFHDNSEDGDVTPSVHYAVVTTNASDYSAGDISVISLEDYSVDNTNYAGGSDAAISTNGSNFYRIGRYLQDNITKFDVNAPEELIWQYDANGDGEEKSNPYKLVMKNDTTAYLIRYGNAKIWIVNPSAESQETFKTGEIDLSSYDATDNNPEAADALLIDNNLYVLMQNQDTSNGYPWIAGTAYIAVIDTTTNTELETTTDSDAHKGIALKGKNPLKMKYLSTNKTIYVAANGPYSGDAMYTGGVEAVKLSDYTTSIIVDDGDDDSHPYGSISNLAILNSTRGYFVGYHAWQNTAVYSFNPTTGEVDATALMENKDISDIEIGPLGDLWVTDRGAHGIKIINTVDHTVLKENIDTELLPSDIEFISVKKAN